jgi:hypothetical protein
MTGPEDAENISSRFMLIFFPKKNNLNFFGAKLKKNIF